MQKIIINFLSILLVSCASTGTNINPPQFNKPTNTNNRYYPSNDWTIRNENDIKPLLNKIKGSRSYTQDGVLIVDLNGGIIDGKKQSGSGNQNENQEPLFRAEIPFALKNGFVMNNKNAATFNAPYSGLKNITFTNIGEDAVATSRKAQNFLIKDCEFINPGGDKSIQLNQAKGAEISNKLIYGGITGVRVHESSWAAKDDEAFCSKNKFIGVDTAWNVSKGKLVVSSPNSYTGVRTPFKINKGAEIKNPDGKVTRE